MPNYGEELVYWYLRLNGFFPIGNFVVHKSSSVHYSADVDIIGIRLPYVYEEIGGQNDDWDSPLLSNFNSSIPIGVICEVKTGHFKVEELFKEEIITYSVGRFGFTSKYANLANEVNRQACTIVSNKFQIAKILFSNKKEITNTDQFFHISLSHARKFIKSRIEKYPAEKHRDRMFFGSLLVQDMIDTTILDS